MEVNKFKASLVICIICVALFIYIHTVKPKKTEMTVKTDDRQLEQNIDDIINKIYNKQLR